ncbi:hypothetical protein ABIF66_001808 [Bradyrhizobium japonicum]
MPRRRIVTFFLAFLLFANQAMAEVPSPAQSGGAVTPVPVPANPDALKRLTKTQKKNPKNMSARPNYIGPCGGAYICYDDSVIHCGGGGRPYEDVPSRECYCWSDSCPTK